MTLLFGIWSTSTMVSLGCVCYYQVSESLELAEDIYIIVPNAYIICTHSAPDNSVVYGTVECINEKVGQAERLAVK